MSGSEELHSTKQGMMIKLFPSGQLRVAQLGIVRIVAGSYADPLQPINVHHEFRVPTDPESVNELGVIKQT